MNPASGVALVTGAASGLGLATTDALLEAGSRVVMCDLESSAGQRLADARGDRAQFAPADVTDEASVAVALDLAEESGPLRVVVNCAGIGMVGRVVANGKPLPAIAFSVVIDVNLLGTMNVVRLGAARMAANESAEGERGVIVNTSSVAAYDGQVGQAAYAASKAAIAGLTLPLARDLADHLIRVVTIAPGMFDTPLLAALPEAARDSLAAQVPHPKRLGFPGEFASLVRHIVENPMLNGEVIRLDGAIRMTPR